MQGLICFIIGHKEKLVHTGRYEYTDEKRNKPTRVVIHGHGKVYECQRCKNQRIGAVNAKHNQ